MASCPEKAAVSPLASPLVSYFGASPLYSIWSARGVTVSVLGWIVIGMFTVSFLQLTWLMATRIVSPDVVVTLLGEPHSLLSLFTVRP